VNKAQEAGTAALWAKLDANTKITRRDRRDD
jgi:hypothetical protein